MTIGERVMGPATVLELSGRLVLGDGDEPLKGKVKDLMQQGATHVMLNMTDVTYVDSAGLGALVGVSLSARHQGREITLVNPSQRLLDLLCMARLRHVVKVCDSEAQALGYLPDPGVQPLPSP
jgi:anti-sigma B factor antagonist